MKDKFLWKEGDLKMDDVEYKISGEDFKKAEKVLNDCIERIKMRREALEDFEKKFNDIPQHSVCNISDIWFGGEPYMWVKPRNTDDVNILVKKFNLSADFVRIDKWNLMMMNFNPIDDGYDYYIISEDMVRDVFVKILQSLPSSTS